MQKVPMVLHFEKGVVIEGEEEAVVEVAEDKESAFVDLSMQQR